MGRRRGRRERKRGDNEGLTPPLAQPDIHIAAEIDEPLLHPSGPLGRAVTNDVAVHEHVEGGETYFEVVMSDAWVWDMYRPARFVKNVRVLTFKDVNVEELAKADLQVPESE